MLKYRLFKILGTSIILVNFFSCSLLKGQRGEKAKKQQEVSGLTFCDTVVRQFHRYPNDFTPVISNINPEYQVTPVTLGDLYSYQIEFKELRIFRKYELWLDDIKFDFDLDANNPNCTKVGDRIVLQVDQIKLGEACLEKKLSEMENKFDCIYSHRWSIKLRGVTCGNVFGPYSETLSNISIQCSN